MSPELKFRVGEAENLKSSLLWIEWRWLHSCDLGNVAKSERLSRVNTNLHFSERTSIIYNKSFVGLG